MGKYPLCVYMNEICPFREGAACTSPRGVCGLPIE